jgi:hypothetical protein
MKNIQFLPINFEGTGEVKGFLFTQLENYEHCYLYSIVSEGEKPHFEVIRKQITPLCIDFKKRIYSDTEFKEFYPKSNQFGITAWACSTLSSAQAKASEIEDTAKQILQD